MFVNLFSLVVINNNNNNNNNYNNTSSMSLAVVKQLNFQKMMPTSGTSKQQIAISVPSTGLICII